MYLFDVNNYLDGLLLSSPFTIYFHTISMFASKNVCKHIAQLNIYVHAITVDAARLMLLVIY